MGHSALTKRTILVVEDDVTIRETIQDLLETRHFQVRTAGSVDEAFNWLSGARTLPSVVLLDRILSHGSTGDELIERLKADSRLSEVPVIMMSGSRGDGSRPELHKPFSVDELLRAIEEVLRPVAEVQAD
jgi:DNA-binding response OmpR family regulator